MEIEMEIEMTENIPQVGDYVICSIDYSDEDEKRLILNNFGKIISISDGLYHLLYFYIGIERYYCNLQDIKHYSNNLESIEVILNSMKFNI